MLRVPLHRSLGAKLFGVIAFVVLATIAVNTWQNSRFFYTQLVLRMQELTMEETRKGANGIETILDSWIGQMAVVTNGISGISQDRYLAFARNFVASNGEFVSFELVMQEDERRLESLGFLMTPNDEDPRFGAVKPSELRKRLAKVSMDILKEEIKGGGEQRIFVRNLGLLVKMPIVMVAMPFYVNGGKGLLWAVLTAWQSRLYAAFPNGMKSEAYLVDGKGRLVSATEEKRILDDRLRYPPYVKKALAEESSYGLNRWEEGGRDMLGAFTVISNYGLRVVTISDGSAAVTAIQAIIRRTILWAVLLVLVAVFVSIVVASGITRNLRDLTHTALQIAAGNFQSAVRVRTRDEVGLLGHTVNHMGARIIEHMHEKMEMVRIEKELETAQMVQDSFFPGDDVLADGTLRITSYFSPASECGGDWWGAFRLSERHRLVCIADATGHGLPAALITAMSYAGTSLMVRFLEKEEANLEDALLSMILEFNRVLSGSKRKFTMTYFAMLIDVQEKKAYYVNAGHNFPILIPKSVDDERLQGRRRRRVLPLANSGVPLGMSATCDLSVKDVQLADGDKILFYTDGLYECPNPNGDQWGKRRFSAAVEKLADQSPEGLKDELLALSASHRAGQAPDDDITVVVVEFGDAAKPEALPASA